MALTASAALAAYPRSALGAAACWWVVDVVLLALVVRGRRWAWRLLTYPTALGAVVFLAAGAGQLATNGRYFERGIALGLAALLLTRQGRFPGDVAP